MNRFSYFALALVACSPPAGAPPTIPFGLQLPGGTLSSVKTLQLRGTAEVDVTIDLFLDAACGGATAVSGSSEAFQGAGLALTVPANQVTRISARAVREGLFSGCSTPIEFTHDDLAPSAPITTNVTSTVAGAMPRVRIEGLTEAGAKVSVFLDESCQGMATAAVVNGTDFSLELAVPANTETVFTVLAIDGAGNRSPCSSPPVRFAHDSQPPPAPVLSTIVPAGPSSNAQPTVTGTAEAGSTVRFFSDSACAVSVPGSVSADTTGAFQVQLTVPRNVTTTLRAAATDASGNKSACSNALTYQHDDLAPALPVFAATTPVSPSRTAMSFQVPVTAEAGTTVQLFSVAGCAGTPAFLQMAPATFTIAISANTVQILSARALDAAGNVSGCASSQVEHDDVAPAVALWTGSVPSSPTNQTNTFSLSGTGEASATATLYRSTNCTTLASTAQVSTAGTFVFSRSVFNNTTQNLTVTLTDPAGNVSACSAPFTLTHDLIAPASPSFWGTLPPSPSSSTLPARFVGTAETNSTVRLFTSSGCSGVPATTAQVTDFINFSNSQGHFSASIAPVLGGTLQLFALAVDAAGNASPCTASSLSYQQRATSAWTDEVTVGTVAASGGAFMQPKVVVLPSGDAVAVWMRNQLLTSGVVTSTLSNGVWSTPVEFAVTGSTIYQPNVVSDASGTVLVGWTQGDVTWAARRSAAGVWAAPENLGSTSYARTPAVALDGAGNGVFVVERFVTSTVRIVARRSVGAVWGAESFISDPNYSSFVPRAAIAPTGRAVVVYARNRGSGISPIDELFSVTGELATGWGAPVQRSVAMVDRDDLVLDLNANGDALAAWLQQPTYNTPYTPMVSQSTGTTWTAAAALTATTTSGRELQARSFANGEALAAYVTTVGALTVARRSAAGVWGTPAALPGLLAAKAFNVRLAAEPGGRAALVWSATDGNGTARYFWFSTMPAGGAWSTPQLLEVGSGENDGAALALDAQGKMFAVWTRSNASESKVMSRRLE